MKHLSWKKGLQLVTLAASMLIGSAALADVKRIAGAHCPTGYTHVTYQQATSKRAKYCNSLQQWDIAL